MSNQLHKLKLDLLKVTGARKFTAKDGSEHVAIPATSLYMGKGAYLDLDMRENRDGEDQYGNSPFIANSPTKEQRMAKEKTPTNRNSKTLTVRINTATAISSLFRQPRSSAWRKRKLRSSAMQKR